MTDQNRKILANFAADLAELRRAAGQPSLRKMADKAHYSHTALSSALSGARLPSQELTTAFVRACDGDEEAWRDRWQRTYALVHGAENPEVAAPAPPPRRRRTLVMAVLAAVLVLAAAGVAVAVWRHDKPRPPAATGVADGTDPKEQHCQVDAVSAQTVAIPDPNPAQPAYGSLTLRYSPHCRAAWPLFVSTEHVPTGVTIRLRAHRPADGAASRFDYPYLVPRQVYSVFGNVLGTARGCVSVAVEISTTDNTGVLAGGETPCLSPAG